MTSSEKENNNEILDSQIPPEHIPSSNENISEDDQLDLFAKENNISDPLVTIPIAEVTGGLSHVPVLSASLEPTSSRSEQMENKTTDLDVASLKEELKKQIIDELKDDQVKKMEEAKIRRERETEEQQAYITKMKDSPDPWVDIVGWLRNDQGVQVELEWNSAFIDYLRTEGITGVDESSVVQKWVVLLMRHMAEEIEEESGEDSEFGG